MPAKPNTEVYRADDGQWHWRLQDANGRIVAVGEGYTRRRDAVRGLKNARDAFAQAGEQEPEQG